jgi:hypothetical protein
MSSYKTTFIKITNQRAASTYTEPQAGSGSRAWNCMEQNPYWKTNGCSLGQGVSFYGNQTFITMFTVRNWTWFWTTWIWSTSSYTERLGPSSNASDLYSGGAQNGSQLWQQMLLSWFFLVPTGVEYSLQNPLFTFKPIIWCHTVWNTEILIALLRNYKWKT